MSYIIVNNSFQSRECSCSVSYKKLRYREEHSASLNWCTLWRFSGENLFDG